MITPRNVLTEKYMIWYWWKTNKLSSAHSESLNKIKTIIKKKKKPRDYTSENV